jgi:glutaredoxin
MRVEIYSKPDCSLCDEAKRLLLALQRQIPFELLERNIEDDIQLFERYRYDIPVVFIDGQKAFKHRLDPDRARERLLRGGGTLVAPNLPAVSKKIPKL